jgi:Tfp pilus assembly protein PilO
LSIARALGRSLLFALAAGLTYLTVHETLLLDLAHRRRDAEAALADARRLADEVRATSGREAEFRTALEELRREVDRIEWLVPPTPDPPAAEARLRTVAAELGVEVSRFKSRLSVDRDLYLEYPYSVALEGHLDDLLGVASRLEQRRTVTRIDTLTLYGSETRGLAHADLIFYEVVVPAR